MSQKSNLKNRCRKYDEEGRLYTYSCGEIIINSDPNSSLGDDLSGVLYTPNIANYSIINPFESPKGALSVKKFLTLPETPDGYPAVTFQLTRQYYSTSEGKWVEDTIFNAANHTVTWSSAEVKAAYEAAKTDQPTGSVTLEQTLLFENLDIYSPTGTSINTPLRSARNIWTDMIPTAVQEI